MVITCKPCRAMLQSYNLEFGWNHKHILVSESSSNTHFDHDYCNLQRAQETSVSLVVLFSGNLAFCCGNLDRWPCFAYFNSMGFDAQNLSILSSLQFWMWFQHTSLTSLRWLLSDESKHVAVLCLWIMFLLFVVVDGDYSLNGRKLGSVQVHCWVLMFNKHQTLSARVLRFW